MDLDWARKIAGINEAVETKGLPLKELSRRMDVAQKALEIAFKLKGPTKKEHLVRIYGNLHKIRTAIEKIEKQLKSKIDKL